MISLVHLDTQSDLIAKSSLVRKLVDLLSSNSDEALQTPLIATIGNMAGNRTSPDLTIPDLISSELTSFEMN